MINLVSAFARGIEKDDNWDGSRLHTSDLGVSQSIEKQDDRKCIKQVWLRYHGYDRNPHSNGTRLMFEQGHALEEKAVEGLINGLYKLDNGWYVMATQMNISGGYDTLTGTLDILLSNGTDYLVIDVKTRRGNAFRYNNDIRQTEKMQVAGYIYALRNLGIPVNHGAILEVDREGQNFAREHHFIYDEKLETEVEETIAYLQLVMEYDMPGTLIPKIKINKNKGANSVVADNPWQCRYCDYRGVSCEGAIPPEFDDNLGRVVGHIREDEFDEKVEGISEYIGGLI